VTPPRTIVHLDADAFFAAVEQASDPKLRGRPVAVGGEKRGIIASASYEARQFGVFTPMPTARARKLCPKLIVLPGDFERYEQFSNWMFGYCYDFTPDVEQTSIDEGYFDLTANRKQPAVEIALTIRKAIGQRLKITISEGIGSNKLISAVASKLTKPAAFNEVPPGGEAAFLHPLLNKWLPGIGPKTSARLNAAGLARIAHIAATPLEMLELMLGSQALSIRQFAHGIDERPLIPAREPQKSFSQQETFARDLTDEEYLEATLRRMADHLFVKVREEGRSIRTLTLKVRYNDMAEDQVSESLPEPTDLETDVYGRLRAMLRAAWKRRVSLRLVSLKLSNVYDGRFRGELPLAVAAERQDAQSRLAPVIDELRRARGPSVILRGHDLRLRDAPREALADEPVRVARPVNYRRERRAPARREPAMFQRAGQEPGAPVQGEPPRSGNRALGPGTSRQRFGLRRQSDSDDGAFERTPGVLTPTRAVRAKAVSPLRSATAVQNLAARRTVQEPNARTRSRRSLVDNYIPLRAHSHYSFLDSTLSPAAIVELAKQHKMSAVALTDTGNLHGAVEFVKAAQAAGLKPILGAELRVGDQPLLLYVESARGYHNLCRLLSRHAERLAANGDEASVANQQRHPLRREQIAEFTDGLIAVSSDISLAEWFPRSFYRLVTSRDTPEDFPAVACPAIHYATPGDRQKFDIVQSIRTLTLLREQHPEKRISGRLHFRPPARMAAACREHPEWLRHTLEIAERCDFQFPFGKPQFPDFHPPDGSTARAFLRRLVLDGLRRRYCERAARFAPQVEEELNIIAAVGYEAYFLVVWDLLQECRARGIEWITRGSAADSLVCYCLGISDVCPIRFDLYFKRFLNPERMALNKLPDVDVDFPHDRKDDVVQLLFARYGREQCAVVGGFSTFQARSAFAEVAKVLGVAERDARKFTEHFPWGFGGGWVPDEPAPKGGQELIELLRASPETRDLPLDEEPYKTAVEMAAFLDGVPRYPKMHPCGVVLSRQPMHELTPTFISNKGLATTHYDMDAVEEIGLVKMDILAQGGLAVMRDARESIAKRGVTVDLAGLEPWEDPEVWEMIAGGGARAVHHIESPAMISLSRMMNVREIDGLVALVSVIRPGAANESKKLSFTRRYQGLEPVTFPHPSLEPCLRGTFGLVVYEEHILQICEAFAGLPPGRADVLRRALVKQKRAVVAEIGREFAASARVRGHDDAKIAEVWQLVTGFSGYAFNKAHSTAYGVEAFQAAWLKRYHPAEFMAGVLTNGKGFYHPLVYVLECHRLGLKFLPPSVNEPGPAFVTTAEGGREKGEGHFDAAAGRTSSFSPLTSHFPSIRVPLTRVKGLTTRTTDRLLAAREQGPFASLADFFRRVAPAGEELEAMIRAGAFDEFGDTRTRQFWQAQHLVKIYGHSTEPNQGWLIPPPGLDQLPGIPLHEPTRLERLQSETELFGFAVSGHPLELFPDVAWDTYCPVNRLGEFVGQTVMACGLVVEQRTHHQITGEPMKFLSLADWTGIVETELFAQTYKSYGLATVRYPVLEIEARVEPFDNGRGFSLRVLRAGKPRVA
jgi:DNA-directed DNA polymerase III PolC